MDRVRNKFLEIPPDNCPKRSKEWEDWTREGQGHVVCLTSPRDENAIEKTRTRFGIGGWARKGE